MSSLTPFICIAPSPIIARSGRPGWAILAPMAKGMPPPIDRSRPARLPVCDGRMSSQLAVVPSRPIDPVTHGSRSSSTVLPSSALAAPACNRSATRCTSWLLLGTVLVWK